MACPGGCIGGGGEPKFGWSVDADILMKRIRATHSIDKTKAVRQSHNNEAVKSLYKELGVGPGQAHLLHTSYKDRTHTVKGASEVGGFGIDPSASRKH